MACLGAATLACEREPGAQSQPPEAAPETPPAAAIEAVTPGSVDRLFRDCASENLPEEIGRLAKCGTADKNHLHVVEIINRNQKPNTEANANAWRDAGATVEVGEMTVDGVTWKTVVGHRFSNGPSEQMVATLAIEPLGVRSIICGDPKGRRCAEVIQRAITEGLTMTPAPEPAAPRSVPAALEGCNARQLNVLETPTFIAECPTGPVASITQVETSSAFKGVAARLRETQIDELRVAKKPFSELSMKGGTGKALRKQSYAGTWIVEAHVEDTPYRMRTITCAERAPTQAPTQAPNEAGESQPATARCVAVIEALVSEPPPYVGVPPVSR